MEGAIHIHARVAQKAVPGSPDGRHTGRTVQGPYHPRPPVPLGYVEVAILVLPRGSPLSSPTTPGPMTARPAAEAAGRVLGRVDQRWRWCVPSTNSLRKPTLTFRSDGLRSTGGVPYAATSPSTSNNKRRAVCAAPYNRGVAPPEVQRL